MPEPAENYVPVSVSANFRPQAFRVWLIAGIVVLVWAILIVVPPVAAANGADSAASPLYSFFSYICHQDPERSFFFLGHKLGVCSRCFGIYFGLLAGFIVYPLWRNIDDIEPISRVWLLVPVVLLGIDWSLTVFGIWENTHLSRFVTGLLVGIACASFIIPGLVEIKRNLTPGRRVAGNID